VIRAKTAELFAAAAEIGPTVANRPKAEIAACRAYGMNLGVAFQLIDDALDYGGQAAKLGKNVGDDFREGKITLPVVLSSGAAMRASALSGSACWKRPKSPRRSRNRAGDDEKTSRFGGYGRACAPLRRHGRDALELFPDSPWRRALLDAVDFCIGRAH